mmetsp:Transcript_45425/g.117526  ORF Transcript_45425/g.117526 Transcript_45425/m.117526 type:complete len:284 (-) Transcript_45425:96-947(-)
MVPSLVPAKLPQPKPAKLPPHVYRVADLSNPEWCSACRRFLWGLSGQGHRCLWCQSLACGDCAAQPGRCPAGKQAVLRAVAEDKVAFELACDELRADEEVALAAVVHDGDALRLADATLRADRRFVLAAVMHSGYALLWASDELRADREVVLAAVRQRASALLYAQEDLQMDRGFILAAVALNGEALKYASEALRADPELLEAARAAPRSPKVAGAVDARCMALGDGSVRTFRRTNLMQRPRRMLVEHSEGAIETPEPAPGIKLLVPAPSRLGVESRAQLAHI